MGRRQSNVKPNTHFDVIMSMRLFKTFNFVDLFLPLRIYHVTATNIQEELVCGDCIIDLVISCDFSKSYEYQYSVILSICDEISHEDQAARYLKWICFVLFYAYLIHAVII